MQNEENTSLNIEDYINLYNSGLLLNRISPLHNQTYAVFAHNKVKVRIVHRQNTYSNPFAFRKIKTLINDNEYFYMLPIETINETIVGFILRGIYSHSYSMVSRVF